MVLGVAAVVILALVRGMNNSLKNVQFSKEEAMAKNLAKEAIEWLVYERDKDWANITSHDGIYCLTELNWPSNEGACAEEDGQVTGTLFWREVTINLAMPTVLPLTPTPIPQADIEVMVKWKSSRKPNFTEPETFSLELALSDWR